MINKQSFAVVLMLVVLSGCAGTPERDRGAENAEASELNLKLGIGYMQHGHYEVALEKLKKSLAYDDSSAEAHNAIAVLYEELEKPDLAEEHYREAAQLDPDFFLARMNYARVLCAHGQPGQGENEFLSLLEQKGFDAPEAAYTGAGVCARKLPDPARAESYFLKALEANPNTASALYELADLKYAQGDYSQARSFLQRFHAVARYNPRSLALGIHIEEALGDQASRRRYIDMLLSNFPKSTEARQFKTSDIE